MLSWAATTQGKTENIQKLTKGKINLDGKSWKPICRVFKSLCHDPWIPDVLHLLASNNSASCMARMPWRVSLNIWLLRSQSPLLACQCSGPEHCHRFAQPLQFASICGIVNGNWLILQRWWDFAPFPKPCFKIQKTPIFKTWTCHSYFLCFLSHLFGGFHQTSRLVPQGRQALGSFGHLLGGELHQVAATEAFGHTWGSTWRLPWRFAHWKHDISTTFYSKKQGFLSCHWFCWSFLD